MTVQPGQPSVRDKFNDPLLSLVLDYGEAAADAARAAALGDQEQARNASHDSFRLLAELFELRDAERMGQQGTSSEAGCQRG